jgi:hypothetical protein
MGTSLSCDVIDDVDYYLDFFRKLFIRKNDVRGRLVSVLGLGLDVRGLPANNALLLHLMRRAFSPCHSLSHIPYPISHIHHLLLSNAL